MVRLGEGKGVIRAEERGGRGSCEGGKPTFVLDWGNVGWGRIVSVGSQLYCSPWNGIFG